MTRIEEILQKATQAGDAHLRYNKIERNAYVLGWIHGAEWADRTMLEKACKWLEDNLYDYAGEDDKRNIVPFDKSIFEDFKNYMKGE